MSDFGKNTILIIKLKIDLLSPIELDFDDKLVHKSLAADKNELFCKKCLNFLAPSVKRGCKIELVKILLAAANSVCDFWIRCCYLACNR